MSVEKILQAWRKGEFKPVYWFEGEERFHIDKLVHYAEHKILSEAEASFNLSIFYGKDAAWPDVVNTCMKYPMFAERQVVILKEAQQMKDLEKLEAYINKPLHSTIFIVAHKDKKIDGRSKLARLLKTKAVVLTTKKMHDNELPDWTSNMVSSKGYSISPKALRLLVDHIGSDLSRMENEVDKVLVNLTSRKNITEDDIETFVGISKEFNVFELQNALGKKDLAKAIQIIQYFDANPKASPIQLVLPSLYSWFSKVFMIFGVSSADERVIAAETGINNFFLKDYLQAAKLYGKAGIERCLVLLHHYNLRSIGINDSGNSPGSLMKEMAVKMIMN